MQFVRDVVNAVPPDFVRISLSEPYQDLISRLNQVLLVNVEFHVEGYSFPLRPRRSIRKTRATSSHLPEALCMLVKSCYYSASTVCIDFFSLYNAEKIMSSDYWNIKSDFFVERPMHVALHHKKQYYFYY